MLSQERVAGPNGHFLLKVFRRGVIVPELCVDEPNLIVNGSKTALAHLLGADVTNRSITQIGFGTSLTAAAPTDTALTGAFVKALDSTSFPGGGTSVQFNFSLGPTENNGMTIGEFGLLTAGSALFARKVRSVGLAKDSDLSFSGSWTINF